MEVWHYQQKKLNIPAPYYFENQWHITEDESYILGSFDKQVVRKWSLDTGQEVQVYQDDVIRPEILSTSTFIPDIWPVGCYLWRTMAGNFVHVGDGPRGWVTPITLSTNSKSVVLPGTPEAVLVDLSETQRLVALLSFEGKLRATCILKNQVLMLNSEGKLFINRGTV